jgi:hypothetical protein
MSVANKIPKPKEIAMGIKNLACLDVSIIMGASPPQVVNVVNKIGQNLWFCFKGFATGKKHHTCPDNQKNRSHYSSFPEV